MPYNGLEIYVTDDESEALELSAQLVLPPTQARNHVEAHEGARGKFWVVVLESSEAVDRARKVRNQMFA